jgi:hypothetical protein
VTGTPNVGRLIKRESRELDTARPPEQLELIRPGVASRTKDRGSLAGTLCEKVPSRAAADQPHRTDIRTAEAANPTRRRHRDSDDRRFFPRLNTPSFYSESQRSETDLDEPRPLPPDMPATSHGSSFIAN